MVSRIVHFFRPMRRDRPLRGLLAGSLLILLAGLVRWSLGELSEGFGPMMLLPAILLSGVLGGARVGVGVAIVCVLVAWTWFFPPYGSIAIEFRDVVTMIIFTLTASFELYVVGTLNSAMEDLGTARERSHTMFRELQHRVANNLQFVAGVLRIGQRNVAGDTAGSGALADARGRLELMSRVHRRLHDPHAVDLPVGRYLEELCADLIAASDSRFVRLTVDARPVVLDLESLMSVSLIVAELVTNSLKHAFAGRSTGAIRIGLEERAGTATLTVADDGPGLPADFEKSRSGSLGQSIVQSLAAQLRGTLVFVSGPGTAARLTFPV
ncbi:MAG TPA: histidine kinase dimerization/phosphoacceptor domain -containing protein [Rhizomicrobium sp.]|jgi:two-component sensor histidine kinase